MYYDDNDFNDPNFDYYMRQFLTPNWNQTIQPFLLCRLKCDDGLYPIVRYNTSLDGLSTEVDKNGTYCAKCDSSCKKCRGSTECTECTAGSFLNITNSSI